MLGLRRPGQSLPVRRWGGWNIVPAYNSEFCRLRSVEARALAEQMTEADAKDAMQTVAEAYLRISLRRAHDEAELALDDATKALNANIGSDPSERLNILRGSVDDK